MNNCFECPFRCKVTGSAHFSCSHPIAEKWEKHFMLLALLGKKPELELNGASILSVDPYGFGEGWAFWPVNFDPTWIKCNLPLPDKDEAIEI